MKHWSIFLSSIFLSSIFLLNPRVLLVVLTPPAPFGVGQDCLLVHEDVI